MYGNARCAQNSRYATQAARRPIPLSEPGCLAVKTGKVFALRQVSFRADYIDAVRVTSLTLWVLNVPGGLLDVVHVFKAAQLGL